MDAVFSDCDEKESFPTKVNTCENNCWGNLTSISPPVLNFTVRETIQHCNIWPADTEVNKKRKTLSKEA